jgi:nucleotide-binding universal stress UspA family protein
MNIGANKSSVVAIGEPTCILVAVPAQATFNETPALRYAIQLAANHRAILSIYVFASVPLAVSATSAGSGSAWLQGESERLERQCSTVRRAVSKLVKQIGVDLIVEQSRSPFEPRFERLVQLARVNDLTVLDAGDPSDTIPRALIEDVLFDSGRPGLVVPAQGGNASPRRIAIAWDGSARAARAVMDAMSLLRTADSVIAVTVTGEKDLSRIAPGADLTTYLARHGVNDCKLATLTARRADVATRLRLFVADEDIDLIVMGAFVHSRFREAILGGVTRSLLDETPVPLFMSH